MFIWIGFLACTAVIIYAGTQLSRYGDIISEKTGMGRTWIGVVLMATVTSLPELVTGISSVTITGVPDIAVGDVIGACVFNMLIIGILDIFSRPVPILAKAHHGNILAAGFGVVFLSLAILCMHLGVRCFHFGWIGLYTIVILGGYPLAMRSIYSYEKKNILEVLGPEKYGRISARKAVSMFLFNSLLVVAAAVILPKIGEVIAETTGLGQTFVGNIFISIATTMPEMVVSIAAVRLGAIDLAIGNLFGSNIFNLFILAIDDLLFFKGPLLSAVSPQHIISAVAAVIMTNIAIIGLVYRASKKYTFFTLGSVMIIAVYVLNLIVLLLLR